MLSVTDTFVIVFVSVQEPFYVEDMNSHYN